MLNCVCFLICDVALCCCFVNLQKQNYCVWFGGCFGLCCFCFVDGCVVGVSRCCCCLLIVLFVVGFVLFVSRCLLLF